MLDNLIKILTAEDCKQVVIAISLLWMGSIAGAALAFLTQVILARQLGPAEFGNISAALAAVTLCAPLAGFGVAQYWLKVFGEEGLEAKRWLPASFYLVGLSTLIVMSVLVCWAIYGPHDEQTRIISLVLSIYVIGQVSLELVGGKLQLEERYLALALWQVLPHLTRFVVVLLLAFSFDQLMNSENVVLAYAAIAGFLAVIGGVQMVSMLTGHFDLKGHGHTKSLTMLETPVVLKVVSHAWPFGLAALFHLVYFQSDIILLKYITGSEAAGIYNVAFTVMAVVLLLPSIIYQKVLLPKMHRWANYDHHRIIHVYRKGNILMLVLGIMAMLAIWGMAPSLMPILFGREYAGATSLLNILAVCAPLLFVASSIGVTLVTQEKMKKKVKYMGVVAMLNIILNVALIPAFGAIGAATATVLSNIVLVVIYRTAAQKYVLTVGLNKAI